MSNKDYYSILGVSKEATKDEIKKAYKKLAITYHPDKQSGKSDEEKKAAEEKFKEATEAYEVLGDDEKRKEYDNPHSSMNFDGFGANFNGGFGGGLDDILREFGGFGNFGDFGKRQNTTNKGQSIRINISLPLEEIFSGTKKKIRYKHMSQCPDCHGKGATKESKVETCSHCGGTGFQYTTKGAWQQMSTCAKCNGVGTIITNPCKKCGGSGLVEEASQIEIDIPKGVANGMQLILQGKGHSPFRCNGINGDLIVLVTEMPHAIFSRHDNDLYFTMEIPVLDGILGCDYQVQSIDGKKLSTKLPQGVVDGTQIRFGGYGMPIYGRNSKGNMIGVVKLKMPKTLSDEEKEVIKQLKEKDNFK